MWHPLSGFRRTRVSALPEFKGHSRKVFRSDCRSHYRAVVCPTAECPGSTVLMADKSSPVRCAECEQLWKDYGDASLKRVRAYGNLKLANIRSDSETMEMLAEAATVAAQKLEEVKRKIQEHESTRHTFQKPTHETE